MSSPNNTVAVWDPFVRFFHWTLVTAFVVAYVTEGEWMLPHSWAGYIITALIGLRLIWGIVGGRYARFSSFVRSPAVVKSYLMDLLHGRAKRYIGHNPAGGAMIIALLLTLTATTVSGMALYGTEGFGPLSGTWLATLPDSFLEGIHELCVNLVLLLVGLHVVGVLHASISHHENLVRAMWNGKKPKDVEEL